MSDQAAEVVEDEFVLAVLPSFLGWWHGDKGDDTPYAICGAVLDALRALPVEQRMEAMGMQRVAVWPDGMRVEAEPDPEGSFWVERGETK